MGQKPQVYMERSLTTLPPGVQGPAKGEVVVTFRWTGNAQRSAEEVSKPAVSVCWWGDTGPRRPIIFSSSSEHGLIYTVTCGPKAFAKYLTDMQQLKVTVSLEYASDRHAVTAQLDLCKLPSVAQVTARIPVTAKGGGLLGTLAVAVSLAHSPFLSSFEMNERRASTDVQMPLYPTSSRVITPLRQLNLQTHSIDSAAAASIANVSPVKPIFKQPACQTQIKLSASSKPPQDAHALSQLLQILIR